MMSPPRRRAAVGQQLAAGATSSKASASSRTTAPIRALLLLLGLVSFAGMPYAVLMPVFADDILHGGARGLGILMGASGVGALIGSVDAGHALDRARPRALGRDRRRRASALGADRVRVLAHRSSLSAIAPRAARHRR